jgi:hypothetical protein
MSKLTLHETNALCQRVIEHVSVRHTELQTLQDDMSHSDAVSSMECLGNAALASADFAYNLMCAEDEVDAAMSSRAIYNCRRAAVGVLLSALDMRAAVARSPFDMNTLSSHASNIGLICDLHGLDAEDCRRLVQRTDAQVGADNVRSLPTRSEATPP